MVLGWGLLCILVWEHWNYRRIESQLAIITITALCFSIVSVCAPGNQVRATVLEGQSIGAPGNLIFTVQAAFLAAMQHMIDLFIKSPLLLFSSMFVWGINRTFKKPVEPVNGFLFIIIGITFCFAFLTFYLPFPYKTGDGIMPGRLLNVTAVFFLVGWFISLFLFWIYFSRLKSTAMLNAMLRISLVMLMALFVLQVRYPNRIQTAWSDLLSGKAIGYKTQIAARMRLFSNKQNQQVQVAPLVNIPTTLCFSDLDSNATDWKNVAYAKYYSLESIRIDFFKK
jgi:hypothetical protein